MPVEKQFKSYHIEKRKRGFFFAEVPYCGVVTSKSKEMEITTLGKQQGNAYATIN